MEEELQLSIEGSTWAPLPRGKRHAETPGTGPAGETCRTCRFLSYHGLTRNYYKCGLVAPTNGPGTDIRLKTPACRRWESR